MQTMRRRKPVETNSKDVQLFEGILLINRTHHKVNPYRIPYHVTITNIIIIIILYY